MRLIQQSVAKEDPDPKAVSCYGLYLPELDEQTWVRRFVDGRPVSGITPRSLSWCADKLEAIGKKKVLVLVWDNASWHISKEVRNWLGKHNREVKKSVGEAGVRIVSCLLPKQSPWLNAIEPKWVYGKRKVVEPDGLLDAYELADRVYRVFGFPHSSIYPFHGRLHDCALARALRDASDANLRAGCLQEAEDQSDEEIVVEARILCATHISGAPFEIDTGKSLSVTTADRLCLATRGYVLQTGAVVSAAPAEKLREGPKVREAYLGEI